MKKITFPFILFLFLPRLSEACAVCFGGADGALRKGFFWGILVLGLLPFLILGFFVVTITLHSRKKNAP